MRNNKSSLLGVIIISVTFSVPVLQTFVNYNNIRQSLTKWLSYCSSFNDLSTDASCVKIGGCYKVLSSLEFNFH